MFEDIKCKDTGQKIVDHRSLYSKKERVDNIVTYFKETKIHDLMKSSEDYDIISELRKMVFYVEYGYIK